MKNLWDEELVSFTFSKQRSKHNKKKDGSRGEGGDLILGDNAITSYREIILGKIRIPSILDSYIHVRCIQPTDH